MSATRISRRELLLLAASSAMRAATPLFEEVKGGISWTHENGRSKDHYLPEALGPGCAFLDYDNDGWMDLFVVNSYSSADIGQWEMHGGLPHSTLFHNVHGRFVDVTGTTGTGLAVRGSGCVAADLDGNGATDLVVTTDGYDANRDDFDAILFPANRGANIAARAGYPSIVVPGGFVTNQPELNVPPGPPFPGGFDPKMAPYGVTFSGPAFSEARLIGLAYAYEQATKHRTPPESTPALRSDTVRRK